MPARNKHYAVWRSSQVRATLLRAAVPPSSGHPSVPGIMTRHHVTACGMAAAFALWLAASMASLSGQAAATPPARPARVAGPPAAGTAAPQTARSTGPPRALRERYCVTCHSDRLKTANLSLQGLDLTKVADDAEVWEKVIRKMRAGVMPPPDLPRPPRAEYEGLRDWLEAEIDSAAAPRPQPGSVVLHRLNRTEYANAIRDLLDLRIDATTLLPPDDSANGFDNIAGSLTLSPTLLESYTTAAARVARMAGGYWKSPTEATYLASSDASQNQRLDGMPFGTRGGIIARHDFPADGEYRFSIQNFGIGSFVPGEQLALIIDGERAHVWPYRGVGAAVGMTADSDGTLEVTVPVRAGSRLVGATAVATNYRPSLDLIKQYDRKSLENNTIPQMQNYPAIGFVRIQGPFNAQRPQDSASRRKILTCKPATAAAEDPCARSILTTVARRAYRRPPTAQETAALMTFFNEGRKSASFEDGIEYALRLILASPQFLVRGEREPATVRAGQ